MEVCPGCSTKVLASDKFCHQCGATLSFGGKVEGKGDAAPEAEVGVVVGDAGPGVARGAPVQPQHPPANQAPMQTVSVVHVEGPAVGGGGFMSSLNQFLAAPFQYTVAAVNLAIPNGHFQVALPRDVAPGQVLKVTVPEGFPPHTGKVVDFRVPPHAIPGGRCMVPLPA